jgi:hypothetical protein
MDLDDTGLSLFKQSIDYFLQQNLLPLKIMYVDDEALIGDLVGRETGCSLLAEPIAIRFAEDNKLRVWKGVDLEIDLYFGYPKDKRSDSVLHEIGLIVEQMWHTAESEH